MSIKSFRVLLMLHLLALVGSVGVDFLPGAIPEALEQAYYELPQPVLVGHAVLLLMAIPLLFAWLAGLVGLFLIKRWGRGLSLYLTLLGLLIYPLTGPSIASGWSGGLSELAALSWGAALACAYFSPVAEAFATGAQRVAARSPQGMNR